VKLKTYPRVTFFRALWLHWLTRIKNVYVLNYINYNKAEAKEVIRRDLNWKDYGGKHFESLFTKFYQTYILPKKFGIDKRKAHLSNLICSGQMTREDAKKELSNPMCEPFELEQDKQFILKKLGLSSEEFELIMNTPIRRHDEFKTDEVYWKRYFSVLRSMNRLLRVVGVRR